jgi:hypothetical protein
MGNNRNSVILKNFGVNSGGVEGAGALDSGRSSLASASQAAAGDSRSELSGGFEGPSSSSLGNGPVKAPPDRAPVVPASASASVLISAIGG